jgi:hypothetical protein
MQRQLIRGRFRQLIFRCQWLIRHNQGNQNAQYFMLGPNGPEICASNGKCTGAAGKSVETLSTSYSGISDPEVAKVARLRGVAAAAGGITLTDSTGTFGSSGGSLPQPSSFTLPADDGGGGPPGG